MPDWEPFVLGRVSLLMELPTLGRDGALLRETALRFRLNVPLWGLALRGRVR